MLSQGEKVNYQGYDGTVVARLGDTVSILFEDHGEKWITRVTEGEVVFCE